MEYRVQIVLSISGQRVILLEKLEKLNKISHGHRLFEKLGWFCPLPEHYSFIGGSGPWNLHIDQYCMNYLEHFQGTEVSDFWMKVIGFGNLLSKVNRLNIEL